MIPRPALAAAVAGDSSVRTATSGDADSACCLQCRKNAGEPAYAKTLFRSLSKPDCLHGPFCARCQRAIDAAVLPACICRALIGSWQSPLPKDAHLSESGHLSARAAQEPMLGAAPCCGLSTPPPRASDVAASDDERSRTPSPLPMRAVRRKLPAKASASCGPSPRTSRASAVVHEANMSSSPAPPPPPPCQRKRGSCSAPHERAAPKAEEAAEEQMTGEPSSAASDGSPSVPARKRRRIGGSRRRRSRRRLARRRACWKRTPRAQLRQLSCRRRRRLRRTREKKTKPRGPKQ
eukprot:TRINITY_DN1470_c0_g7_i1.p1 TRINITY_DN1470_c0_g7~~TRINITY_DN1470_c0_g7_i1.p1  ORF type:complete len:311 (-),score=53.91 TRINITY_DN1470_c0_g7_i1:72-950(-)